LIGIVHTTYGDLSKSTSFDIINPEKLIKKNYKNSGVLNIKFIQEFKLPSFLDYIRGGTEVNLVVGIDYTASNGEPDDPKSLHFISETEPVFNPYVAAIKIEGEVLAPYDSDKLYPAFGFGAKLVPLQNKTSHCFPINFNKEDPNCIGIDGILESYVNSFDELTLAGPTNFAPIIEKVSGMAEASMKVQKGSKYFILLMITDGEVQDMDATIEAIKKACALPVSIIIVGVGSNDFEKMDKLDADQKVLKKITKNPKEKKSEDDLKKEEEKKKEMEKARKSFDSRESTDMRKSVEDLSRKTALSLDKVFERDIVQFVPFKVFEGLPLWKLAKHTLEEVPYQLIQFMTKYSISPLTGTKDKSVSGKKDTFILS